MSAVPIEDDTFVAKARIYHRYHITGFPMPGGRRSLTAVQQQPLPFISAEEEADLLTKVISPLEDDADALRQLKVREVATQESATLESSLSPANMLRYPDFEEFLARHEERAKLVVRLFHTDIENPKQVHQFRGFHMRGDADPDVYLFAAPGQLVDTFLRRLASATTTQLDIDVPVLDLQRLAGAGSALIRGASFRIDGRPNLKTAMVFGPGVNEDDAWEEYSQIGELRYVQLQIVFEADEVKLMVTQRGSLMPYGMNDIGEELRLCRDVYNQFLKQFETGRRPLIKKRQGKNRRTR